MSELSAVSAPLIVAGFALAIAGAMGRGHVRKRLRDSGVRLSNWVTITDDLSNGLEYFQIARRNAAPLWPAILWCCLPLAFLVIVAAIILSR